MIEVKKGRESSVNPVIFFKVQPVSGTAWSKAKTLTTFPPLRTRSAGISPGAHG